MNDALTLDQIRVVTLVGGVLIGAISAVVALRNQRLSNQQYSTTSFYSALDKLGHAEASVRTGAIYALEHLATFSPKAYYWTVVSALCAYLREYSQVTRYYEARRNAPNTKHAEEIENLRTKALRFMISPELDVVPEDIIAAFTVLGRRKFARVRPTYLQMTIRGKTFRLCINRGAPRGFERNRRLDLRDLWMIHLPRTNDTLNFSYAVFGAASFSYGNLTDAIFTDALFYEAEFECTILRRADFRGASLRGCQLSWARLFNANLAGADIVASRFHGAEMRGAKTDGLKGNGEGSGDLLSHADFDKEMDEHFEDIER